MLKKILTSTILSLVAIGGFFGSMPMPIEQNIGIAFISEAHGSNATPATPVKIVEKSQEEAMKDMYNKLVAGLNILLDIVTILVSPAIMLAGWLMSPDWTSGDLFNLRPTIHKLWVMVSNVTYFIYAILLIFIALATIFNSDKYGYKQLLPKLALGIILVPLSWWFVQFIISMASVVTASVINIPLETVQTYMDSRPGRTGWWETKSIPQEYQFYTDPGSIARGAASQYSDCIPGKCLSPKDVLSSGAGMYSALLVYGNAIFKFTEVKKLSSTVDATVNIIALIHQGIIAAVMSIIFGLLVLALVFMLMMRAIKLWFYAMFSPLMTLKYVLGDGVFGNKENGESFDLKEFIGLAFVPALVGLALSFGIMILALLQSSDPTNTGTTCTQAMIESPTGCELAAIMGSSANRIVRKVETAAAYGHEVGDLNLTEVHIGGLTFKFYGSVLKVNESSATAAANVSNQRSILSVTGGIFGTLIIDIIGLVFIWVAFMAAKNVSKAASAAIEPFEKLGKSIGGMAGSLPKYVPILPGGVSIAGAERLAGDMRSNMESASIKKTQDSPLGKLVNANKFANGDTKVAADKLSSSSNKEDFEKVLHLTRRDQGQGRTANEQTAKFLNALLGMKEDDRNAMIERLEISNKEGLRAELHNMKDKTYTEHDPKLEKAKGYIGGGGGTSSGAGTQGVITANKVAGDDTKIVVSFNDQNIQFNVKDGSYKSEDKKGLEKMISNITEEDFRKKSAGISDVVRQKILTDMKDKFRKPGDGTSSGSENTNIPPTPKPDEPKK